MLRNIRLVTTFFKIPNYLVASNKYKGYKCVCRSVNTESTSRLLQRSIETNRILTSFENAAKTLCLDISKLTDSVKMNVILHCSIDQFINSTETFLDYGFEDRTILKFIEEHPSLFHMRTAELRTLLSLWQERDVNADLIVELLSKHPQLIELMGPVLIDRIRHLLPYFEHEKFVALLFLNVPGVIYENWNTLKPKLDFLNSHNIPMRKVANCTALQLSLFEIKTRFTFLERAGMYKKREDLFKKDLKIKNATVRNILCSDDKLFAETIAKLTLVEFEAFKELYKLEEEIDDELVEEDSE